MHSAAQSTQVYHALLFNSVSYVFALNCDTVFALLGFTGELWIDFQLYLLAGLVPLSNLTQYSWYL